MEGMVEWGEFGRDRGGWRTSEFARLRGKAKGQSQANEAGEQRDETHQEKIAQKEYRREEE